VGDSVQADQTADAALRPDTAHGGAPLVAALLCAVGLAAAVAVWAVGAHWLVALTVGWITPALAVAFLFGVAVVSPARRPRTRGATGLGPRARATRAPVGG
jgi:hypothetical protein